MSRLGIYGPPEMIRVHGQERIKYLTEVQAAALILDPSSPQFGPLPETRLYCYVCKQHKPRDAFHVDMSRKYRQCRDNRCMACKKAKRLKGLRTV